MPSRGKSSHILVIDYTPEILQLLKDLLVEEGYHVTTQSQPEDDLAVFNRLDPDLIVMDYLWPTHDDNWSLVQQLRSNPWTQTTPIVLCTAAVSQTHALQDLLTTIQVDVILKPFDLNVLLSAISKALANRRPVKYPLP